MPVNEFIHFPKRTPMADETLSEKLARYNVALQLDGIPAEVIAAAKLHILDSLGCLLAGSRLEPGTTGLQYGGAQPLAMPHVDAFWNC